MSIAFVQTTQSRSVTTLTLTGVTAGNFLIYDYVVGGSNQLLSISDSTGDTWTNPANVYAQTSGFVSDIWVAGNVQAGTHILTFTFTNGSANVANLSEFSGVDTTTPVYGGANLNQNGSTDSVGPDLTSLAAADVLVVVIEAAGNVDVTPWTNLTGIFGPTGGYFAPGSPGTYHATNIDAQNFSSSGIVLKAAGGSPPSSLETTPFLSFD